MSNNIMDLPVPEINVPILARINETIINSKSFRIHPVYDLCGSSLDGFITHIVRKNPRRGSKKSNGYLSVAVRKRGESKFRSYQSHRFIWECYNGVIQGNKVVDHINDEKEDNRLCNLQLITQQQNCMKSAKNRDYSFAMKGHRNKKCVKAVNYSNNEVTYFDSIYATHQHLDINHSLIWMACGGLNGVKFCISKKDGCRYKFNYITKEELPEDHKRSLGKRGRKKKGIIRNKYVLDYQWKSKNEKTTVT
jgi:hypothetical protein